MVGEKIASNLVQGVDYLLLMISVCDGVQTEHVPMLGFNPIETK